MKYILNLKNLLKLILKKLNLKITKYSSFEFLLKSQKSIKDTLFLKLLINLNEKNILKTIKYYPFSKSELIQDLFVLNKLNFKKKGFFVEFGAMDGEIASNTHLLEKKFLWCGILCEPNKNYIKKLKRKRNVKIVSKLVWENSYSDLLFEVASQPGLSTISNFVSSDFHNREIIDKYFIKSISLNDLLVKYNAPQIIDYLSIDTEGSEYQILKKFNFKKFKFRIISIEQNNLKKKKLIRKLLTNNGYKRYVNTYTDSSYDDIFYHQKYIN